jgi:hypothetical protein
MDNEIIVMVFMAIMIAVIVLTSKLFAVTNETLATFKPHDNTPIKASPVKNGLYESIKSKIKLFNPKEKQ